MSHSKEELHVARGLDGVIITDTRISGIHNDQVVIRGYDIRELAGIVPFEAVAFLLWVGHFPNSEELVTFRKNLLEHRRLPEEISSFLASVPKDSDPVAVLRTSASMKSLWSNMKKRDDPTLEIGTGLAAQLPTIICSFERQRKGLHVIEPRDELSHASNYLYMISGKVPSAEHEKAMDAYFTLLSENGMSSSTFSAVVTASTLSDAYSSVTSAIGTLKGALHGGAPRKVWEMLEEINEPSNSLRWLSKKVQRGEKVMGFGHRIFKTDPRSVVMKSIAQKIATPEKFELATIVEADAKKVLHERHPDRLFEPNVEFYSALVLDALGIPNDLFTPTLACARIFGWIAHILEQQSDNKLFRPSSAYIGPLGLRVPAQNFV